jgi:ABC-type Fe3+/spermidine/putrescine transport system ATPase subunit
MLEVIDIRMSYESTPLLRGISFTVAAGEIVCLLGASGSGKSTLLRLIAGLETPEHGDIRWDGQDLTGVPAHRRNFGLMFQDYALFPHLTVAENVAFGLKMQKLPRAETENDVTGALQQVNLSGFEHRRVTELSGGEQQRVALARALAPHPRLLMFDEPLGALDRTLKDRLLDELRSILHTTGIPAIYVTHDQEEAFAIADRVLLLHEGKIVRSGTPAEVWNDPGSAWAARFLGLGNVLEGVCRSNFGALNVETSVGTFNLICGHKHQPGEKVNLLVRPSEALPRGVALSAHAEGLSKGSRGVRTEVDGILRGRVTDVTFHQERFKVTFENGLYFYLSEAPQVGEIICLHLPPKAVQCLP